MNPILLIQVLSIVAILILQGCGGGGGGGGGSTNPGGPTCALASSQLDLSMDIRDFLATHPDMEAYIGSETGIVESSLGGDGKPVYSNLGSVTTTGQTEFDQWYRNVGGVNILITQNLTLLETAPGQFQYSNSAFFPIDGLGFGNTPTYSNNFHFTTEVRFWFRFSGSEVLGFLGDDDFWTFINGNLAIDLGGVHGPLAGSVDLSNAVTVTSLGITSGQIYEVAIFQAERHTLNSNYFLTLTNFTFCSGP